MGSLGAQGNPQHFRKFNKLGKHKSGSVPVVGEWVPPWIAVPKESSSSDQQPERLIFEATGGIGRSMASQGDG